MFSPLSLQGWCLHLQTPIRLQLSLKTEVRKRQSPSLKSTSSIKARRTDDLRSPIIPPPNFPKPLQVRTERLEVEMRVKSVLNKLSMEKDGVNGSGVLTCEPRTKMMMNAPSLFSLLCVIERKLVPRRWVNERNQGKVAYKTKQLEVKGKEQPGSILNRSVPLNRLNELKNHTPARAEPTLVWARLTNELKRAELEKSKIAALSLEIAAPSKIASLSLEIAALSLPDRE
ncbi:hypothetical protein L1887_21201 [Cichorium endivia]|nr:hypothetical protein L1887_21201 [Cichorium endivia]